MWGAAARIISTLISIAVAASPFTGSKHSFARRKLVGSSPTELLAAPISGKAVFSLNADTKSGQSDNATSLEARTALKNDVLRVKQEARRARVAKWTAAWHELGELAHWRYRQEHPLANESDIEDALRLERTYGMRPEDAAVETLASVPDMRSSTASPQLQAERSPVETVDAKSEKALDDAAKRLDLAESEAGSEIPAQTRSEKLRIAADADSIASQGHNQAVVDTPKKADDHATSRASSSTRASRCVAGDARGPAERWERQRQLSLLQDSGGAVYDIHSFLRSVMKPMFGTGSDSERHISVATSAARWMAQKFRRAGSRPSTKLSRATMYRLKREEFDRVCKDQAGGGMFSFIMNLIKEFGGTVVNEGGLAEMVPLYRGSKDPESFMRLMEELNAISHAQDGWLKLPRAGSFKMLQIGYGPDHFPAGVGTVASLSEQGYQAVVFTHRSPEMRQFIQRAIQQNGFEVSDDGGLSGLVPFYSGECGSRSFKELLSEMKEVSTMPGKWLHHTHLEGTERAG